MTACILTVCEREADAGPWCRHHWNEMEQRDVEILLQTHDLESLAHAVVVERRRIQFLVDTDEHQPEFGTCCGHMKQVHTHGGCTGLSGGGQGHMGQGEWYACKCRAWEPTP